LAGISDQLQRLSVRFFFRHYLAAIFLLALGVRVALIFLLGNFDRVQGMENEFMALNLLAGKGIALAYVVNEMPSALVGPVYTIFLYLHFLLFGKNYLPVELTQAFLGSGSAVILALIARRIFNDRTALTAGALLALYPTYAYWCALPIQLTVDVFMLEVSILLVMVAVERPKPAWHALAGAWIGLLALSKSFYLSFLVLYLVWWMLWKKPGFKKLLSAGIIWTACAAMVIAPWTARNYHVFHQWVPLTTNGGGNLWYGNNDQATGALYTREGKSMLSVIPEPLMAKLRLAKTEAEKDRLLAEAGREWIRSHPAGFIKLIPLRLRAIWWFDPEMATGFPLLRKMVYLALLALAIPGIALSRKSWRPLAIFYLIPVWQTAFYSAFVGQARFRYLIEFTLLAFAAFFLTWLAMFLKPRPLRNPGSKFYV